MERLRQVLIWDLPTRLFHWLFAAGFLIAFLLALTFDDESPLFSYHSLLGLIVVWLVVLRFVWGLIGSRHARFSSMLFSPKEFLEYTVGALRGNARRYDGHNPGSSYVAFAMFAVVVALAVTGVSLGSENEAAEDLHEILAYLMLALVAAHIAGILLHTIRHRENIALSMITGRKAASPEAAIPSAQPLAGAAFLVLTGAWSWSLLASYDPATNTARIPLLGKQVYLGEPEEEGEEYERLESPEGGGYREGDYDDDEHEFEDDD